jgi:hypothetical protein
VSLEEVGRKWVSVRMKRGKGDVHSDVGVVSRRVDGKDELLNPNVSEEGEELRSLPGSALVVLGA